ncbi:uncharacterized protein LOC141679196 [Apium graveolens]|uniref:uncharacterized protein LOC141679196 n=1 Tax=Apium graveolens TaxID=4045 RepID=UPI003D793E13
MAPPALPDKSIVEEILLVRLAVKSVHGHHIRLSILSRSTLSEMHIDDVPYLASSKNRSKDEMHIIGSINGLVCLGSFSIEHQCIMLWNPSIHLFKKIIPQRRVSSMLGFSWDPVENDYKFIAELYDSSKAIVYSYKTDCWSDIVVPQFVCGYYLYMFPSAIVKDICYWKRAGNSSKILKFEAKNNQLTYLDIPCVCGSYSLVNLNDCLARIDYAWDGSGPMDVYNFHEESSCRSKIYTFNTEIAHFRCFLTCFKSGGMIFEFDGKLNLYDPKSNEIKSFGCYNGTNGFALHGFSDTPTLVVLEGMKPLHQ